MLDWIGSLRIREKTKRRVVLGLSGSTRALGAALAVGGTFAALRVWEISALLALVPIVVGILGGVLATLQRNVVIDREAGVLRVEQSALGLSSQSVVPLFHLRAVVVMARGDDAQLLPTGSRYVAYLDRRVGEAIYLDESRRCAGLLRLAEVIADVAELRLEYEAAPPHMAG